MQPSSPKRPFGLKVIILLQILQIILSFLILAGLLVPEIETFTNIGTLDRNLAIVSAVASVVLGILAIIGVWMLRRWGWILLMLRVGVDLILTILAYFTGTPDYITMLIAVITVFYLNQTDVQNLFLTRIKRNQRVERESEVLI